MGAAGEGGRGNCGSQAAAPAELRPCAGLSPPHLCCSGSAQAFWELLLVGGGGGTQLPRPSLLVAFLCLSAGGFSQKSLKMKAVAQVFWSLSRAEKPC